MWCRMNQNLHGLPIDEAGQDSLIKEYLDNALVDSLSMFPTGTT